MPDLAKVNSTLAFLRAEIPAEDISANPVVVHPHNTSRTIPERLSPAIVKELSQLDTARALIATAGEWVSIAGAIALCTLFWHPALYVLAVVFIGESIASWMTFGRTQQAPVYEDEEEAAE